ncbi:LacI family DNA-binding transcriptional regulator [Paenibacillus thermotolerans]|uniref:LacI family DNA-binding transcriptional regulator n=1 Tax=Paenibacillus thermotolerans TaxID=3027807 RepID=UPI002368D0C6|nr:MULTISPECIES: LacI family DNA-binding transcriptional regulator [unclassified Paenibacillus]
MDVKIRDVALRANVSPTTVSRVLNGNPRVKTSTREKVLNVIEQMNYVPNAAAKNLRSQRTMTLGVIVPDVRVSFFGEILKGIEIRAYSEKYKVVICDTQNDPNREAEYLGLLSDRSVDGMILIVPMLDAVDLGPYLDRGYTIGIIGSAPEHENLLNVHTDNMKAACEAVCHLIETGHKDIAYISGHPNASDSYDRLEGYIRALREHAIPFRPELLDAGGFSEEGGYEAFYKLIERNIPFTAVFCANDEMALGVYKACAELNLRIPEDVAVVGFDNDRVTGYLSPALTTVHQPKIEMGEEIAAMMIRLLHDEKIESRVKRLDSVLIKRDSTKLSETPENR